MLESSTHSLLLVHCGERERQWFQRHMLSSQHGTNLTHGFGLVIDLSGPMSWIKLLLHK